jgi:sugar phosphate isomerase/epimerase
MESRVPWPWLGCVDWALGPIPPAWNRLEIEGDDLGRLLRLAAGSGFDGIELSWSSSAVDEDTLLARDRIDRMREAIAASGCAISSLIMGWHLLDLRPDRRKAHLTSQDEDQRRRAVRMLALGIEVCRQLGIRTALVPFFGPRADLRLKDNYAAAVESLRELASAVPASEVRVGLETTLPASGVLQLIEDVASPQVGAYWDAGNAVCLGYDPVQELRLLRSNLVGIQIKDYRPPSRPRPDASLIERWNAHDFMREFSGVGVHPLGDGVVPLDRILQELEAVGFAGCLVLEYHLPGATPPEVLASDVALIRRLCRASSATVS